MTVVRAHITLPAELLACIDALVGERGRSKYIVEALETRVRRDRQLATLKALGTAPPRTAPAAWDGQDAAEWVHNERRKLSQRELDIEARHPTGGMCRSQKRQIPRDTSPGLAYLSTSS
ncbi:MAG: hypothetical protein ACKVT1_16825 [Dehalococcoidia bacterium]